MLSPGFYVNHREFVSRADEGSRMLHIFANEWLVTDGTFLGRFDKERLEWMPVQWSPGNLVRLTDRLSNQLETWSRPVSFSHLEAAFERLVEMPDAPTPDMPKPPLKGLATYMRSRQHTMSASVYDWR